MVIEKGLDLLIDLFVSFIVFFMSKYLLILATVFVCVRTINKMIMEALTIPKISIVFGKMAVSTII